MHNQGFQFSFTTASTPAQAFELILDPTKWWVGLYNEQIVGKTKVLHDEFHYKAGDGLHASSHKLVDLIPNKKIVWLVTNSHLSFLKNPSEWTGTRMVFTFEHSDKGTTITFIHEGLVQDIECYQACSTAWTSYLQTLSARLSK